MHIPVRRCGLIQGPEPPSPGGPPFTLNAMVPCSRYSAFTYASPVGVAAAMRPSYDHLPPLERALPYLVDTLYAELDSISRLLATRPPGSLSLGDVDVISHLIKVSSDFRECLQESRCYTCTWSCARSPASSPPPSGSPVESAETFNVNEREPGILLNTHVEPREEPRLRPLDLYPVPTPPPPPQHQKLESYAAEAAIPSDLNDESKVYQKPRAGAWHIVFSRFTTIARRLFKLSSRS